MARHGENIRKRKDGRWEARVVCGRQANGKAKYKYLYGHSYDEVKKRKNELMTDDAKKAAVAGTSKVTVKTLMEEWLYDVQDHVKESTMAKYQFYAYKHIIPELGQFLLSKLDNENIEQFKRRKLDSGRVDKAGGLSAKTVIDMLSVLKLALMYGEEKQYFSNGQIKIHNPRQIRPQISILMPQEQQKLEKAILFTDEECHLGIVIALYAGLRIGEVCALKWEDINFSNATLKVCRTIMRIPNYNSESGSKTKIVIERPKTECSNRLIPLPEFLINYLRHYQKNDYCYIMTGTQSFIEPRNYYKKYKRIMGKCGLDGFNFHALRHTFATRCIENGFDVKSLSEILGHADVSITMQRYAHPSMTLKRYYMEKLDMVTFHGHENGQTF